MKGAFSDIQRPGRIWIRRVWALALAASTLLVLAGCVAAAQPSELGYLQALEKSHHLDAKAVKACTQGYTPPEHPLAAKNSTLKFVRHLMANTGALKNDELLSSNRQGYAAICVLPSTDNGKAVKSAEYHLAPPADGGGGEGGLILEW